METNERIFVEGWKGKDAIEIVRGLKGFSISEHRKEKETGDIQEHITFVPLANYEALQGIILKLNRGEKYGAKYLWRKIIEQHKLHFIEGVSIEIMLNMFNGGENRAKYYFPMYYYPMKILEAKGVIQYLGRGGCIRL